jgi:deoxyribodipyrimidine photo-lyase
LARDRLWGLRREQGFAEAADAIQRRHGSRRSGLARSGPARGPRRSALGDNSQQLDLNLDLQPTQVASGGA